MGVLLNKGGRESAKESESERDGVGGWVGGGIFTSPKQC